MARRRPQPASGSNDPEAPEQYRRCRVEDWVTPAEADDLVERDADGDRGWSAAWTALRRWQAFRRQWLEEHAIPLREQHKVWPMGFPSDGDDEPEHSRPNGRTATEGISR